MLPSSAAHGSAMIAIKLVTPSDNPLTEAVPVEVSSAQVRLNFEVPTLSVEPSAATTLAVSDVVAFLKI